MSRFKHLLLVLALVLGLTPPALAASSNVNGLTASGTIVGTQLFYCPIGAATDLKCTAAQIAAYAYSLMSGDCTATGTGAITCTKTNGTAFSGLATLAGSTAGDIAYYNGSAWTRLAGNSGAALFLQEASGVPSWVAGGSSGVSSITTTCPASGPSTGAVTLTNGIPTIAPAGNVYAAGDCGGATDFNISTLTTVTLPDPAVVGAGWYLSYVQNDPRSTNNVTVTPIAGTINGASSYVLPPGSSVAFRSNGTNYEATNGVGRDILIFTATGTCSGSSCYTPNPALVEANVGCIGAGGSGGGGGIAPTGTAMPGGGSGAAGASKIIHLTAAEITAQLSGGVVPFTIATQPTGGAGATSGTSTASGTSGTSTATATLFGSSLACANGGGGGGSGIAGSAGGSGAGLSANGNNATANSAAGPAGGAPGGAPGVGNNSTGAGAFWCAGVGGSGSVTTGGAGTLGNAGSCAGSGGGGGGFPTAGTQAAGGAGGYAAGGSARNGSNNGGTAGTAGGGTGGNGASGLQTDGVFASNGMGLVGGGGGAGGGSASSAGVPGGNGGDGGYGSGGGGGGAGQIVGGVAVAGGNGGKGGPAAIQVEEINR